MTNKEFRSNLAKEMRDKYNERNEKLEQVDKLPLSESVKELAKREIMENFYKEMDEMKSRPWYEEARRTHLEEIRAKNKLVKSKKEYEDSLKAYEDAQIAHGWKVEENITENSEEYEKVNRMKLEDFRKMLERKIHCKSMGKIIEVVKNIPLKEEIQSDGSRLIEFKLWNNTYKILKSSVKLDWWRQNMIFIEKGNKGVGLWSRMKYIDERMANYIWYKEKQWRYIPKIEDMKALLSELWKEADLDEESDQIAMLMYLIGLGWMFKLVLPDDKFEYYGLWCWSEARLFHWEKVLTLDDL